MGISVVVSPTRATHRMPMTTKFPPICEENLVPNRKLDFTRFPICSQMILDKGLMDYIWAK